MNSNEIGEPEGSQNQVASGMLRMQKRERISKYFSISL